MELNKPEKRTEGLGPKPVLRRFSHQDRSLCSPVVYLEKESSQRRLGGGGGGGGGWEVLSTHP